MCSFKAREDRFVVIICDVLLENISGTIVSAQVEKQFRQFLLNVCFTPSYFMCPVGYTLPQSNFFSGF